MIVGLPTVPYTVTQLPLYEIYVTIRCIAEWGWLVDGMNVGRFFRCCCGTGCRNTVVSTVIVVHTTAGLTSTVTATVIRQP